MQELIGEKVSVLMLYDRMSGLVMPQKLKWQGRVYAIDTIGYHHKVKEGKTLLHIFSVANKTLAFRLSFNTDNLHWTLEEVSDGLVS